ncbi:PREDICTED: atherin-like [Prunus mume]|uniref:Atherin-like n=1 Tax=Prunus mume TaxID=102107 RepID=A0ABM0NRQ9_PRUMU|nr:PREDICTED: atherin-like [Prunus mume]
MMRGTFIIILMFAVGTWISSAHARALIGTNPRDQSMRIIMFGRSSTSAAPSLPHKSRPPLHFGRTPTDAGCPPRPPLHFGPTPPDAGRPPKPSPGPPKYHGIVTGGGSLRVSNVASF